MILKFLIRVDKKKQSVKIKKNRKCQKGEQNILIVSLRFIQKKICFGPHFYTPIKKLKKMDSILIITFKSHQNLIYFSNSLIVKHFILVIKGQLLV
jgi:hypothetical protein